MGDIMKIGEIWWTYLNQRWYYKTPMCHLLFVIYCLSSIVCHLLLIYIHHITYFLYISTVFTICHIFRSGWHMTIICHPHPYVMSEWDVLTMCHICSPYVICGWHKLTVCNLFSQYITYIQPMPHVNQTCSPCYICSSYVTYVYHMSPLVEIYLLQVIILRYMTHMFTIY